MSPDLTNQLNEQKRKVDFDSFDITVKELTNMVGDLLIDIAPEYQRQFRWNEERQSTFIESVYLGIPIPSLFMAANADGTWELIDGVQRLSTLIHYVGENEIRERLELGEPLVLTELGKLSDFNGKNFSQLPKSIQLQFLLKPLKVTTISDKSDLNVRFDLFERLNTGGVILTPQEIRSCIYRGEFNEFLKELSDYEPFHTAVRLPKESEKNGTREEYVLRFFAFLYDYKKFDHSVIDFLNTFMAKATKRFNFDENTELFHNVFNRLADAFPEGITRGNRSTTPVNLYEGIAVGAALALQEVGEIVITDARKWSQSDVLKNFTTGATNSKPMVAGRIEYCRDKFKGL